MPEREVNFILASFFYSPLPSILGNASKDRNSPHSFFKNFLKTEGF